MTSKIDARLAELGLTLPETPAPVANYLPFVIAGNIVHVSGQVSSDGQGGLKGRLGDTASLGDGVAAAKLCGLALIAQLRAACGGDLDRVKRVVRLGGFVASAPDFFDQPKVVNGASDLMVEVFGDAGRHARAAVGVAALPAGFAVEIDGIFEIE
ncbi:RidA family protein [Mangrovicoccus sp. HB161399]|uniref:RidA family protein n=1 Tax=Mangrovicoccus sp. HB161399 TaxID=2720392 RepID=UPI001557F7E9|nr:RidA family protein [Mangrovicoccus sp. HB161399]